MHNEIYKPCSLYRPINKNHITSKLKNDLVNFPELIKQPIEQSIEQSTEQPTNTKSWTEIVKTESTVQNVQNKQLPIPPKRKNKIKKNIIVDDNDDNNEIIIKKPKQKKEIDKVDEDGWNIVASGIKKENIETIRNDDNIKRKKQEEKNKVINNLIRNVIEN